MKGLKLFQKDDESDLHSPSARRISQSEFLEKFLGSSTTRSTSRTNSALSQSKQVELPKPVEPVPKPVTQPEESVESTIEQEIELPAFLRNSNPPRERKLSVEIEIQESPKIPRKEIVVNLTEQGTGWINTSLSNEFYF